MTSGGEAGTRETSASRIFTPFIPRRHARPPSRRLTTHECIIRRICASLCLHHDGYAQGTSTAATEDSVPSPPFHSRVDSALRGRLLLAPRTIMFLLTVYTNIYMYLPNGTPRALVWRNASPSVGYRRQLAHRATSRRPRGGVAGEAVPRERQVQRPPRHVALAGVARPPRSWYPRPAPRSRGTQQGHARAHPTSTIHEDIQGGQTTV